MIGIFKHKKSGCLYVANDYIKFEIPFLNYWICFVEYKKYYGADNTKYFRTERRFKSSFEKATLEDLNKTEGL